MSVEIDWKALTTGPDGEALASTIRDFIHDKFQDVPLPKFIRSVKVHSFEFGEEAPTIILKDICDPLDEFYEDDESSEDSDNIETSGLESSTATLIPNATETIAVPVVPVSVHGGPEPLRIRRGVDAQGLRADLDASRRESLGFMGGTHRPGLRTAPSFVDQLASPLLSRSNTPAIPGGTSNLSYFHAPLSAGGLSGTQTPLAAAASGMNQFPAPWSDYNFPGRGVPAPLPPSHRPEPLPPPDSAQSTGDLSTRPSTANTHNLSHMQNMSDYSPDHHDALTEMPSPRPEPSPNDIQLVMHVKYSGHVRLALSAEILLDYPMSSFVSIPLQLTITGVTFDGVAIVAHVRPSESEAEDAKEGEGRGRAHVCFLSQEDASAVLGASAAELGDEDDDDGQPSGLSPLRERKDGLADHAATGTKHEETHEMPGLLKEIRVESEIGQRQDGRQSLKNVGKVEKFVLEQVRRIFEDEFVWPSFWTFLI